LCPAARGRLQTRDPACSPRGASRYTTAGSIRGRVY
jgi:hypothetical protein